MVLYNSSSFNSQLIKSNHKTSGKQITSASSMHKAGHSKPVSGTIRGIGWGGRWVQDGGDTRTRVADSCWWMAKATIHLHNYCKVSSLQLKTKTKTSGKTQSFEDSWLKLVKNRNSYSNSGHHLYLKIQTTMEKHCTFI